MAAAGTEFGEAVKAARKEAGYYQWELANMAGTSVSTISQIEQGRRKRPRGDLGDRIARVLGIDPPGKVREASSTASARYQIEGAVTSYLGGDRLRARIVMDVLDLARQSMDQGSERQGEASVGKAV